MALPPETLENTSLARDDFDRHYAEKIWDLIPEVYRYEDGTAKPAGQLRALVEIIAKQAAHQRRSIDRLLADSRIDEADDWAIAYIGELLGTRLLDPRNSAGRRADVANTLNYRRRAGTARLLETLAADAAGWDAVAHEAFKHLFRNPHKWERHFEIGTMTGTPRGGYPDMRSLRIGDTSFGPFEDAAHYPAVRSAGRGGPFYGIADVTLHCFRKLAFELSGVTPWQLDSTHFTLDPSGRGHVPLYQPGSERDDDCQIPHEWNIRQPVTCRRLDDVRYALPTGAQLTDSNFLPLVGRTFDNARDLTAAASNAGVANIDALLDLCLVEDCPKARLLQNPDIATTAVRIAVNGSYPRLEDIAPAGLEEWADGVVLEAGTELLIDPARGLVQLPSAVTMQPDLIWYGAYRGIGAGSYERVGRVPDTADTTLSQPPANLSPLTGNREVDSSATYVSTVDTITVTGDAHLYGVDGERPYLLIRNDDARLVLEPADDSVTTLELSGLWIGIERAGGNSRSELRINGNWDRVVLRDVTLDPGGTRAALVGDTPERIAHVELVIAGEIGELIIDNCVIGSIRHDDDALTSDLPCSSAKITICDTIVQSAGAPPALDLLGANVEMDRCTVLGAVRLTRAEISDSIINGPLDVQDAQGSCLRFSMVQNGGRIPSPYESLILPDGLPRGSIESRRFGDPGFCVLTDCAPEQVRTGAEGALEMGAHNTALFPVKQSDLLAKVAEFAPVQAQIHLVMET